MFEGSFFGVQLSYALWELINFILFRFQIVTLTFGFRNKTTLNFNDKATSMNIDALIVHCIHSILFLKVLVATLTFKYIAWYVKILETTTQFSLSKQLYLALLITSNLKSMTQLTTHSYNNVNISTPNIRFVFIVFLITFINIHIILKTYMFSLLQCLSEHYFCLWLSFYEINICLRFLYQNNYISLK